MVTIAMFLIDHGDQRLMPEGHRLRHLTVYFAEATNDWHVLYSFTNMKTKHAWTMLDLKTCENN